MTEPSTAAPEPSAAPPAATAATAATTVSVPMNVSVNVSVNGEPREIPAGTTLGALVASLTRAPSGVAAAVNESVVPRGGWDATGLAEGDRIEILTAVQGG